LTQNSHFGYNTSIVNKKEQTMSELHQLIADALCMGMSDRSIIELMVEEGLPREACAEILSTFQKSVGSWQTVTL
jgi:DNA-binding transcriptional regulator YhcF (GntR family)